jgi:hypothetical protein
MTITKNLREKAPRRPIPTIVAPSELKDDRLEGAGEIALFIYGVDDLKHRKIVFHMVRAKLIPFGKLGGRIVASKRALADWQHRLTTGQGK